MVMPARKKKAGTIRQQEIKREDAPDAVRYFTKIPERPQRIPERKIYTYPLFSVVFNSSISLYHDYTTHLVYHRFLFRNIVNSEKNRFLNTAPIGAYVIPKCAGHSFLPDRRLPLPPSWGSH